MYYQNTQYEEILLEDIFKLALLAWHLRLLNTSKFDFLLNSYDVVSSFSKHLKKNLVVL